jgi:hypothetical protein
MKAIIILLILVSCGKDPASSKQTEEVIAFTQPEETEGTSWCKDSPDCMSYCQRINSPCVEDCRKTHLKNSHLCPQICFAKMGNCQWSSCGRSCAINAFYPYYHYATAELCDKLQCSGSFVVP